MWMSVSFRQLVLPREGQEQGQSELRLDVVGEAQIFGEPGLLVLGAWFAARVEARGDGRVLELVEEHVVPDLEHRGEVAREEDAQTSAEAPGRPDLVLEGAV